LAIGHNSHKLESSMSCGKFKPLKLKQAPDHLADPLKLHLPAHRIRPRFHERKIANLMRGGGNDLHLWPQLTKGPNQLVPFAIVQIVINDQQIKIAARQRIARRCETRCYVNLMRPQKLPANLLRKNRRGFRYKGSSSWTSFQTAPVSHWQFVQHPV